MKKPFYTAGLMVIVATAAFLCLMILFSGCKKQDAEPEGTGSAIFYTDVPNQDHYHVIFDGAEYGDLNYAMGGPACGSQGYVTIEATVGEHTYDFKSMDGHAWGSPKKLTIKKDQCVPVDW